MQKFLEALAIALHLFIMIPLRFLVGAYLIYLIFQGGIFRWISLLYTLHLYWDYGIQERGGRRCNWFINSFYLKLLKNYFPVKLHLTCDLDPSKNYLMVHHPHGVMYFGMFIGMTGFDRFNLKSYVCTLNCNFFTPVAKEYILACGCYLLAVANGSVLKLELLGLVGVSEKSLKYLLDDSNKGNLVSLIPGGAAEAALTYPGEYRIVLKSRRGFCRIALETGADIIPSFTFGEVDAFNVIPFPQGSFIRNIQEMVKNATLTFLVIYRGSWPLSYWLTMPKRVPINTVVGKPIKVKKNVKPTKEDIQMLHEKYTSEIRKLFDEHKKNFLKDPNVNLIVE